MKITDTMRMDWIEKDSAGGCRYYIRLAGTSRPQFRLKREDEKGVRSYFDETLSKHRTVRLAVDAAIRAEKARSK